MLDYERDLNELLHSADVDKDKESLSRAYFEFRMRDPQRYRLFDRLEEKVVKGNQVPELVEELHKIRASNFEHLTLLIKGRISEGKLEDVPPYYHYCAAWALVHGAVALYHSAVLEQRAGRPGRLLPLPHGHRRTHGQQAQARRRRQRRTHARSRRRITRRPGLEHQLKGFGVGCARDGAEAASDDHSPVFRHRYLGGDNA